MNVQAMQTPPAPGVAVTPDAGAVTVVAGARTQTFQVRNVGTQPASFLLTTRCLDTQLGSSVTCSAPTSTSLLAPGSEESVSVGFTASVGQELSVSLLARQADAVGVQDAGWADVVAMSAAGTATPAPSVALVDLQSMGANDRGDCVTVVVAPRAAYECGDLRVAHSLPAHRTRGRTWSPVLLYNSQHANPRPTVYADVSIPANSLRPTYLEVLVALAGGPTYSAAIDGGEFAPGVTRRIGVQWNALSTATGLYGYTVQVTAVYGAVRVTSAAAAGEIAIVNRSASPFGAGWWWAGWEQVVCVGCGAGSQGRMLWIRGDGGTQVFEPGPVADRWIAQNPHGAADTLYRVTEGGSTFYRRRLEGGGEINLDASGIHFRTINRLGQVTAFDHGGGRLNGVYVPNTGNGVAPAWLLTYTGGRLTQVSAGIQNGPWRAVQITNTSGPVTEIRDPDQQRVSFSYDTVPHRIAGQTDRRGTHTSYTYDAAGKLTVARLRMGAAPNDAVDLVRRFQPAESRGVVRVGTTGFSAPRMQAHTQIDGPRTEVADLTRVYLDGRGLVRRVVSPLGEATVVNRRDARFAALATEMVGATGLRTTAVYDDAGRVSSVTAHDPYGTGWNQTTVYRWDERWSLPDTVQVFADSGAVRRPLGATTYAAYDAVTGNVLWQRVGEVDARRVEFRYYPAGHPHAGQVASVIGPTDAEGRRGRDSVAYDGMGNLALTVSPAGYLAQYVRDRLGRDSLVITPTDTVGAKTLPGLQASGAQRLTLYDAMGWDTLTVTTGPAMTHAPRSGWGPPASPPQTVHVRTLRDGEGAPRRISRWTTPDSAGIGTLVTDYLYDPAGRPLRVIEGLETERFAYDGAGNDTLRITGRGYSIQSRYDELGRLIRRTVPAVLYERTCHVLNVGAAPVDSGGKEIPDPSSTQPGEVENETGATTTATSCSRYPEYPNEPAGGLLIPADSTIYRYDPLGQLAYAQNGDAIVERGYYPNGMLRDEMLRMRTYSGADFSRHVYQHSYRYDLLGRLTSLHHPAALAGASSVDTFTYSPATGALESARDRVGTHFDFRYDNAGRNTSVQQSFNGAASVVDSMRYDVEGRRTWRREYQMVSPFGVLHDETYLYDARGKVLLVNDVAGGATHSQWYSGLGMLTATHWGNLQNPAYSIEEFRADALGNVYARRSGATGARSIYPWLNSAYQGGSGRVTLITTQPPATPVEAYAPEETSRTYDGSGNLDLSVRQVFAQDDPGYVARHSRSRSFYGADDRLRYFQKNDVGVSGNTYAPLERGGVWEEYRYDPLGRRIMVRSNQSSLCTASTQVTCVSHITRYVWAGDQVLWELRAPGGSGVDLEQTWGSHDRMGWVSYFHARGIDRPLTITKYGHGTVIPHENWRGQFSRGTFQNGQASDYEHRPTSTSPTLDIAWPGWRTTAWHQDTQPRDIRTWWGELVDGMRDQSGQMYRRNRYYDPETGQFTQPDPIGIAGGLNSYGFAVGDPVSYSDPYGLCAWGIGRDAALGLCTEVDAWHAPQTQGECERTQSGACKTYIPVRQWDAVGNQIRRLPTTGKCGWIRTEMLTLWRRGADSGHFWFWEGLDVLARNSRGRPIRWRVAQYVHDPAHPYFEFEARVFWESSVAVPHEGLHMYYHHHPEPNVEYNVLHARMYEEQNDCRLR